MALPIPEVAPVTSTVLPFKDQSEVGENERARSDLNKALELKPRDRRANTLIRQFDVDPQAVLGREYFEYTVRYGESLSLIAARFLGDPLEFYILARYNGIDNPSPDSVAGPPGTSATRAPVTGAPVPRSTTAGRDAGELN